MKEKRKHEHSVEANKRRATLSSLEDVKNCIAAHSIQLLEDPQGNIEILNELLKYANIREEAKTRPLRNAFEISQLAILSLLAVFKDILPGYRIHHAPLEDGKATGHIKLTKEVKQLQEYEKSLLRYYESFVRSMFRILDEEKLVAANLKSELLPTLYQKLTIIALRCVCELLQSHPFFNMSMDCLVRVLPYLDLPDKEKSSVVYEAVTNIFKSDETGELSLEAVNILQKVIERRSIAIQPSVLQLFLSLRILHEMPQENTNGDNLPSNKRNTNHVSKRKKKLEKHEKELKKDIEEANALQNADWRESRSRNVLTSVLSCYLRILNAFKGKSNLIYKEKEYLLLKYLFEGLEMYMHLMPMDTFTSMLNGLKEYLGNTIKKKGDFTTILLALHVVSKLTITLQTESGDLIVILYGILKDFEQIPTESLPQLANIVHMMVIRKRQYSQPRIAAFVKRISKIALNSSDERKTTFALKLVYSISVAYKSAVGKLFDLEENDGPVDAYQDWMEDPDLSMANRTTLVEIQRLALEKKNEYCKALIALMVDGEGHLSARQQGCLYELSQLTYDEVLFGKK